MVPATCKNMLFQDMPLPKRKLPKTRTELEPIAADVAKAQAGQLQSKLHMEDLAVACRYTGVSGRLAADDVEANSAPDDNLEFEWALQSGDWDWKEARGRGSRICAGHLGRLWCHGLMHVPSLKLSPARSFDVAFRCMCARCSSAGAASGSSRRNS